MKGHSRSPPGSIPPSPTAIRYVRAQYTRYLLDRDALTDVARDDLEGADTLRALGEALIEHSPPPPTIADVHAAEAARTAADARTVLQAVDRSCTRYGEHGHPLLLAVRGLRHAVGMLLDRVQELEARALLEDPARYDLTDLGLRARSSELEPADGDA